MNAPWRQRAVPLGLAALSYGLAVVQRPGQLVADTKIDLHTHPGHFLTQVVDPWTPTGSLGHVFAGQYGGYLFPMGPFFALGHAIGLSDWLVHRLWLGTLLALATYSVVRLLDALYTPRRGTAHPVAALPWLLLAVHRGLRDPRGWWWPAAFALVLTSTGGGVNAAVTGWLLLGPVLFLAYEVLFAGVEREAVTPYLARVVPLAILASAWWVIPVAVHSIYGLNFLPFTEQPGTIWQTTSVTESLRLLGYWLSYIGIGYGGKLHSYFGDSRVMLFHPAVVIASLLVPALALGGFVWTRRWRYGPWFLGLSLAGAIVMVAGFPDGTPLRRALTFTYNHVEAVQFLRTTYKAGPLPPPRPPCLGGAAAHEAWRRLAG